MINVNKKYWCLEEEDLYELNTKLREGIFENEIVLIPKSKVNPISQPVQKPDVTTTGQPSSNVILHTVEPKETKFGISKKYGITIQELEELNPEIVSNLEIGYKLRISGTSENSEQVSQTENKSILVLPKAVSPEPIEGQILKKQILMYI